MIRIDDEFINKVKSDYDRANVLVKSNMEFEIRLSEEECGYGVYPLLFKSLESNCNKKYKKIESDSIVKIYQKREKELVTEYREINTNYSNPERKTKICQIKTKPETSDIYYRGINVNYCFRLSFSQENPIDCPPDNKGNLIFTRNRKRREFDTGKGYMFVFTIVEQSNKKDQQLEVEVEFNLDKLSVDIVEQSITELMNLYLISNISLESEKNIIKKFNEMLTEKGKKIYSSPKPINLNDRGEFNIYEIFNKHGYPYQVTNKLDGERCYLLFMNDQVFSIQNDVVNFVCKIEKQEKYSIVDTEKFKDKYYFFDCYVYEGKPVYNNKLSYRLEYANVLATKNPSLFIMKKFSTLLAKQTKDLLLTLNRDDNDGIIYTPEDPSLKLPIYKWKFPEKMSIDFQVQTEEKIGEKYKLFVGYKDGTTPFLIDKKQALYISKDKLDDGGIYEFTYDNVNKKFVLLRERKDKVKPNYINTALDVWNDMQKPFTEDQLKELFRPLHFFRKYHNQIKREMINKFCRGKQILDLGIGNGGDLPKYKDIGAKGVIGVEPYDKNYKELKRRLEDDKKSKKQFLDIPFTLIETSAQNTREIDEKVGVDGVDIVSSFFSLSFFFFPDKPNDLLQLVQTISQNLKEGGYFIGTTIDGERTKQLLEIPTMPNKTFDFDDGFIRLNSDNTITFEVKGAIVETQIESLVDFKRLKVELEKVGIIEDDENKETFFTTTEYIETCKICKRNMADDKDDQNNQNDKHKCVGIFLPHPSRMLSQNEKMLNSLYRRFVFKKREISREISKLPECEKNSLANLLTKSVSNDYECYELFKKIVESNKKSMKKLDISQIPREDIYSALQQFYFYKKYIEPIKTISEQIVKWYSIYGTRIDKKSVIENIPKKSLVPLLEYNIKTDFPVLREQLINTLSELKSHSIIYNIENGLYVYKDNTGYLRLLFTDYNSFSKQSLDSTSEKIFDKDVEKLLLFLQ
jgi:SAM-dependent methyltransferase